jgi:hypothetical protein
MAVALRFLAAILVCAGAGPALAAPEVPADLTFVLKRDGSPIGTQRFTFRAEGERLAVDIAIDIKVTVAFITVYTYTLRGREVWEDKRLVSFESDTDDNGTKLRVRVHAAADGLHVEGKDGSYTAPADALTSSYWRAETLKHTRFIDIEDGRMIDMITQPAGRRPVAVGARMVDTDIYKLSGEMEGEVGYTPAGEWTLLRFRSHGSDILYTRAP